MKKQKTVILFVTAIFLLTGCVAMDQPPGTRPAIRPTTLQQIDPRISELSVNMIGMSEKEAIETAEKQNITTRVAKRDGQKLIMTTDRNLDRINLVVKKKVVVDTSLG